MQIYVSTFIRSSKKAIAAKEIYIENPEALISFIIYGQVDYYLKVILIIMKLQNY
ncbi:MAG: hypothetical protein ACLRQF_22525 [Thomasclavelia ramosa]